MATSEERRVLKNSDKQFYKTFNNLTEYNH